MAEPNSAVGAQPKSMKPSEPHSASPPAHRKGNESFRDVRSVPPAHLRPSGKHAVSTSATANPTTKPPVKIEAAYHKADAAIQKLIDLLAA